MAAVTLTAEAVTLEAATAAEDVIDSKINKISLPDLPDITKKYKTLDFTGKFGYNNGM